MTNQKNIISEWLEWHFSEMPKLILQIWKSYLIFCADFFSVPLLLSTLLSPWRQEGFRRKKGFDIGEFFSSLVYSTFSRLMGAMLRLALIGAGVICEILVFCTGLAIIVLWFLIPLILIGLVFAILYVAF